MGLEARGGEHVEELPLRALVDAYANQFALAIEDVRARDARDVEELVHGAVGIDENRRVIVRSSEELAYLEWILIGDGENHEALRLVSAYR